MAVQLLLCMGSAEVPCLTSAAETAQPALRPRIGEVTDAVCRGAKPDPAVWPTLPKCIARLRDKDEVVATIAAQMLALHTVRLGAHLPAPCRKRVTPLLADARRRPCCVRCGVPRSLRR